MAIVSEGVAERSTQYGSIELGDAAPPTVRHRGRSAAIVSAVVILGGLASLCASRGVVVRRAMPQVVHEDSASARPADTEFDDLIASLEAAHAAGELPRQAGPLVQAQAQNKAMQEQLSLMKQLQDQISTLAWMQQEHTRSQIAIPGPPPQVQTSQGPAPALAVAAAAAPRAEVVASGSVAPPTTTLSISDGINTYSFEHGRGTISGQLSAVKPHQYFSFRAVAGETYRVRTELDANSELKEAAMYLLATDQTSVLVTAEDPEGLGHVIEWTCPETGKYYIRVSSGSHPDQHGAFSLTVALETPDPCSGVAILRDGQGLVDASAGSISFFEDGRDHIDCRWLVQCREGTMVQIRVTAAKMTKRYDRLTLHDGRTPDDHAIMVVSGADADVAGKRAPVEGTGSEVLLRFTSELAGRQDGFIASYHCGDPSCARGVRSADHRVCCPKECDHCGGPNCQVAGSGQGECCTEHVDRDRPCTDKVAPCVLTMDSCGVYGGDNSSCLKVDCELSKWSTESPCSDKCGTGTVILTRKVMRAPRNGGAACAALRKERACGALRKWSAWTACDATCGQDGVQRRSFVVVQQLASDYNTGETGSECPSDEMRPCKGLCRGMHDASFQQGVNEYSGCVDTTIGSSSFLTPGFHQGQTLVVQTRKLGGAFQALIRFDGMFDGDQADSIPFGVRVDQAVLRLYVLAGVGGLGGGSVELHRMLVPWDSDTNWMSFGGHGVSLDGIHAERVATADLRRDVRYNLAEDEVIVPGDTFVELDITAVVADWATGDHPNHGFVVIQPAFDGEPAEGGELAKEPPPGINFASAQYDGTDPNNPYAAAKFHPKIGVKYFVEIKRDCAYSDWRDEGECTQRCGGGLKKQVRMLEQAAQDGGTCEGSLARMVVCNENPCLQIDCQVSKWEAGGLCKLQDGRDCGTGELYQTREILVTAVAGGKRCPSNYDRVVPCETPCNCIVTAWKALGNCTEPCNGGTQVQVRKVIREASGGGTPCQALQQELACNEHACPIGCDLSDWSDWSQCSMGCGLGEQLRTRKILRKAEFGGQCPDQNLLQSKTCNLGPCAKPGCVLSDFAGVGKCSSSCNGGVMMQQRQVLMHPPGDKLTSCGELERRVPCNVGISCVGCTDPTACNYDADATLEDGSCFYDSLTHDCDQNCKTKVDCAGTCGGTLEEDECGLCGGLGVLPWHCDCHAHVLDECGVCGGLGILEGQCNCQGERVDACNVCGGPGTPKGFCDCEGTKVLDECGVCGGPGIPDGLCDCTGHTLDECGICGGPGIPDASCDCHDNRVDECGVCGGKGIAEDRCNCAGNYFDGCGVCGGDGVVDECGVCNGPGAPAGHCDCNGNTLDECSVCGGSGIPKGFCDCLGNVTDVCGACGGDGIGPTNCDCKGGVEDECGDCGGSGKLDKCGICDGPGIPLGFCDCDGHVMDECNVCGGTGKPEGACDCAGNHIDACGDCGGPGLALDNAEWKDTYGDSCERYHDRKEFCGFEDSIMQCQTSCHVCPEIIAVHTGESSSLNHANIHIGGTAKWWEGYGKCAEDQDPWGYRCEDYVKLGISCDKLIRYFAYDCHCSCYDQREQMKKDGTLPEMAHMHEQGSPSHKMVRNDHGKAPSLRKRGSDSSTGMPTLP